MVAESSTVAFAVAANATAVSVAIIFIFECFCISAKPFRRSLRSLSAHALLVCKVQKYENVRKIAILICVEIGGKGLIHSPSSIGEGGGMALCFDDLTTR